MAEQITLDDFLARRRKYDRPGGLFDRERITVRCGCRFSECEGWSTEEWLFAPRSWQALPDFIGPLEDAPYDT